MRGCQLAIALDPDEVRHRSAWCADEQGWSIRWVDEWTADLAHGSIVADALLSLKPHQRVTVEIRAGAPRTTNVVFWHTETGWEGKKDRERRRARKLFDALVQAVVDAHEADGHHVARTELKA